jgi:non-specific protein-tyrosine kinase
VVTATHPSSRAANAFRLVQVGTARWTAAERGATTILVTSAEARDGKTTVAANLAVAYAQAGNRVLVVSCDLRRPAIHEKFGVSEEPGLTDVLRSMDHEGESLKASPYLKPCSILRVAVLPAGTATDRPTELLGSGAMRRLVERLKQITDVVILDCAPLVVAGDVVPLLPMADGVVLVAHAGKTRRAVAASSATLLERLGLVVGGVVLNDAREFSIPLAKRRMYQPARKVRKAADVQPQGNEAWISTLVVEPPAAHDVTPPEVEPSYTDEPREVKDADEIVRIPDLPESAEPVEQVSQPTRGSSSDRLKALRDELAELREELASGQVDTDQTSVESRRSLPIGFRPGSDHSG